MKKLIGKALAVTTLATASYALAAAPEAVPGEYIVKLRNGVSINSQTLTQSLKSYIKSEIPGQNIVVIKRPVFETQTSVLKTLSLNPQVEIVEPNFIYRTSRTPNDPSIGQLWGLNNFGQKDSENSSGVAGVDVRAEKAWDITTGSDDVLVAVIDTGVNYNHPDLKDNMWMNQAEAQGKAGVDDDNNGVIDDIYGANFVTDRVTGNPMDDHGHGSHCAGTIGARGNDGKGIVGVAWNVKILGAKFLSKDGSGSLEGALKAIDYSTKMGARILSNSWGGGGFSETLKQAIERSNDAGALFVAAAGNEATNNDRSPSYPASYDVPNVISVAAINNKGQLASFSNYGKTKVHVAAPGVNVYSSVLGNRYDSWSGTSMATPHVSGVATLLAAAEPNLTNVQMKERILGTARPLGTLRGKVRTGLVDAYAMLTNTAPAPDENDPTNWTKQDVSVSSAHPYKPKSKETYEVSIPGAKQISLFFAKFDTERGFDKVELYDANGILVESISGSADETYSMPVTGSKVTIVFTSDDSVESYGFDIVKAAYR